MAHFSRHGEQSPTPESQNLASHGQESPDGTLLLSASQEVQVSYAEHVKQE